MSERSAVMVATHRLSREYRTGASVVHALREVDLEVARGELIAVRGRSGSGKTTLLSILGGLDRPTSGDVSIDGASLGAMDADGLVELRRRRIGFIFQAFGLLSILTAAENVEVPLRLIRTDPRERDDRVAVLLELVGLGDRARHRPHELSGGEQQRVAIARALANQPLIMLADEPTGRLDSVSGRHILDLLDDLRRERGLTVIMVTHDMTVAARAGRIIRMLDGRIVADERTQAASADGAEELQRSKT
jgi:putative ABC transport system ATP-binding protein